MVTELVITKTPTMTAIQSLTSMTLSHLMKTNPLILMVTEPETTKTPTMTMTDGLMSMKVHAVLML